MLETLWQQIIQLPQNNWDVPALPKPFDDFEAELKAQSEVRTTTPY
jgi:hypothetical protein